MHILLVQMIEQVLYPVPDVCIDKYKCISCFIQTENDAVSKGWLLGKYFCSQLYTHVCYHHVPKVYVYVCQYMYAIVWEFCASPEVLWDFLMTGSNVLLYFMAKE